MFQVSTLTNHLLGAAYAVGLKPASRRCVCPGDVPAGNPEPGEEPGAAVTALDCCVQEDSAAGRSRARPPGDGDLP